ncbi:unnamed protein product, partial [Leptidea sinapis]
SYL